MGGVCFLLFVCARECMVVNLGVGHVVGSDMNVG